MAKWHHSSHEIGVKARAEALKRSNQTEQKEKKNQDKKKRLDAGECLSGLLI